MSNVADKIREKLLLVRTMHQHFADPTWRSYLGLELVAYLWYQAHGYIEHQRYEMADEFAEMAATELWGNFWRPQEWPETPNYPRRYTTFCPKEGVKHHGL